MKLTALDIHHKEFRHSLRGYSEEAHGLPRRVDDRREHHAERLRILHRDLLRGGALYLGAAPLGTRPQRNAFAATAIPTAAAHVRTTPGQPAACRASPGSADPSVPPT